jgi:hypothetical protein
MAVKSLEESEDILLLEATRLSHLGNFRVIRYICLCLFPGIPIDKDTNIREEQQILQTPSEGI